MSVSYANELYELRRWVDNVNQGFASNQPMIAAPNTPPSVKRLIGIVSNGIKDEYPHYASTLARVADILFIQTGYGTFSINPIAFGEMFVMIRHIQAEPVNMQSWSMIHSRISKVAFDLYRDGHFGTAAEKSVKELETRLRELCTEVPCSISGSAKIGDIIAALLKEGGIFEFCNDTTSSGKNYRRGVQAIFEGIFADYRNPAAHANISCSKREAIEQIMLASQLMAILDKPLALAEKSV